MLKQVPRRARFRPTADDNPAAAGAIAPAQSRWYVTLGCGLSGAVLLWAAFPPLDWPLLAWVAPLPWLWLVRLPSLPGWRPYLVLWLAGSLHWLLMLQGIRLAHPALYGGWLALSIYLGIYLPLFVALTRIAVQRLKVSLVIAAPVVWMGLELLRGHLVTGFSNGLLAHTQAEIPLLIQVSDLAGGYTLSFIIILVTACLTRMIPVSWGGRWSSSEDGCGSRSEPQPSATVCWWPLLPIAAALAATLLYGNWRLTEPHATGPKARIALIQGSLDTVFGEERLVETLDHYRALTGRATAVQPNLDLIIWPESSLLARESLIEEPLAPLPNVPISVEQLRINLEDAQGEFVHLLAGEAARASARTSADPGTKLLVGSTSYVFGPSPPRMYNSALVADRDGRITCRYFKTHPVMFGEYIPFGEWLPWLYRITPIGMGLSRGDGPRVFEAAGVTLAPNICFESTIPHLVRRQLVELRRRGTPADVIVNVSNDGWFWGSSILDLHFRSNILRAVENRRPLVVAANTGISAWIDGNGVVQNRAQRRTPDVLLVELQADGRGSPYHTLGDWPAWLCAAACIGLALLGCRRADWRGPRPATRE